MDARDVSTQVLTKISETPLKALNATLASSWIAELNDTIGLTRARIHERISSDLPDFERQLATSVSVQERLRSLSQNIDVLYQSVSSPESGLVHNLVYTLTNHAALAQEAADVRAQHAALAHLLRCRNEFNRLTHLVEKAELPDATKTCKSLELMLAEAPHPLSQSEITSDLKRRITTIRSRTEEQLLDAYCRSIVISESEVSIKLVVQAVLPRVLSNGVWVRSYAEGDNVETVIRLPELLASIGPSALSMHLTTLKRDITTHCIEYVLKQPVQIREVQSSDLMGTSEHKLSLEREPPGSEDVLIRLSHLTTVMAFLSTHLFPRLPPGERKTFPLSLCTPIRTAILNLLLLPNLPSSLSGLPGFLKLAKRTVQAEEEIIIQMLGDNGADRSIKSWVDGVGLHYERKRRADILNKARMIVAHPPDDGTFRVEVPLVLEDKPIVVQDDDKPVVVNGGVKTSAPVEGDDNAWGLDDTPGQSEVSPAEGWDFDDEVEPEPDLEPTPEQAVLPPDTPESIPPESGEDGDHESGDTWGLNDDTEDDSAWDDPWDEKPSAPEPAPPHPAPKPAKGLEKRFAPKSVPNSPAFPPPHSPTVPAHPPPQPAPLPAAPKTPADPPPRLKPVQVTESYVVSRRTKELLQLVEDVLREGAELVSSGILNATASSSPGKVIIQAAPMVLELFRALVPVTNAVGLKQSAKEPMRFSNDCMYMGQELRRIVAGLRGSEQGASAKLEDGLEKLKVLADSWFEDTIAGEERQIDEILDNARGFIDTTQQDRYDECESAVNDVLRRIRRVAPQWKAVLTKSRYYDALGSLVEAALSRILGDVLALEDITEVESHRLCELCHILNALEGLFVEDPEQPPFVVSYVPSWLKFSYLSELLEASIADISYLFEEGALVDFEIEELAKLVRALFADTPLRANTINKLQQGHPAR